MTGNYLGAREAVNCKRSSDIVAGAGLRGRDVLTIAPPILHQGTLTTTMATATRMSKR